MKGASFVDLSSISGQRIRDPLQEEHDPGVHRRMRRGLAQFVSERCDSGQHVSTIAHAH